MTTTILDRVAKTPGEVIDYVVSYARWLDDNDPLVDAIVTINASAPVVGQVVEDQHDITQTEVRVRLSGGTAPNVDKVTVKGIAASGQKKDFSFLVQIKES